MEHHFFFLISPHGNIFLKTLQSNEFKNGTSFFFFHTGSFKKKINSQKIKIIKNNQK